MAVGAVGAVEEAVAVVEEAVAVGGVVAVAVEGVAGVAAVRLLLWPARRL